MQAVSAARAPAKERHCGVRHRPSGIQVTDNCIVSASSSSSSSSGTLLLSGKAFSSGKLRARAAPAPASLAVRSALPAVLQGRRAADLCGYGKLCRADPHTPSGRGPAPPVNRRVSTPGPGKREVEQDQARTRSTGRPLVRGCTPTKLAVPGARLLSKGASPPTGRVPPAPCPKWRGALTPSACDRQQRKRQARIAPCGRGAAHCCGCRASPQPQ